MVFESILVAVDFRQPSLAAARWAAEQFKAAKTLEVVHVSPVPEMPKFLGTVNPGEATEEPSLDGRIQGLRGFVDTLPGDNATAQVRVGQEVTEIRRRAATMEADLVILGRSPASTANGRTLYRLIRGLNVPALVISGAPAAGPRRILVGVDDGPIGASVTAWAAALADHFGADLTLLHVLNPKGMLPRSAGSSNGTQLDPRRVVINRTHYWLRELYRKVTGEPFKGRTTVAIGSAGPVIREHAIATAADMIIVGRNGRHAEGPTELGTTTRMLLRGVRLPIVVVPPERPALLNDRFERSMVQRAAPGPEPARISLAELSVLGPVGQPPNRMAGRLEPHFSQGETL
jgi:nucleotide-binding universal stress UspA family protein